MEYDCMLPGPPGDVQTDRGSGFKGLEDRGPIHGWKLYKHVFQVKRYCSALILPTGLSGESGGASVLKKPDLPLMFWLTWPSMCPASTPLSQNICIQYDSR
ncbi:hypothetical protein EYF80_047373 [Liparis tanakae]|uniref:Uncharacterized protein n=1 Tax=Liparis tanakae TaxID=230148 RepID=A0A4Z2FMR4_9TELE|nr:hypothetical protein EYF80_047373 [Liparis tanakae]